MGHWQLEVADPAGEPASQQASQPASQSASQLASQPVGRPAGQPASGQPSQPRASQRQEPPNSYHRQVAYFIYQYNMIFNNIIMIISIYRKIHPRHLPDPV